MTPLQVRKNGKLRSTTLIEHTATLPGDESWGQDHLVAIAVFNV